MLIEAAQRTAQRALFSRHESSISSWQVMVWWEARRVPYNLMVGAVGIVTFSLCLGTASLCEHFLGEAIGFPNPPIVAVIFVVVYGLMANVCFTGGWVAEIIVGKIWPKESAAFGQISFCLGLVFSLLLTLLPGALTAVVGAFSLLGHFVSK